MKYIKVSLLGVAKWLLVAALVVFLCSTTSQGKESSTDFTTMAELVMAECDQSLMTLGDDQMIRRLYGIDPNEFEDILLYYPMTNMGAEEVLLIKLKNTDQLDTLSTAINSRLATQLDSFEGYGVAQTALLQQAITELRGNYALFVCGEFASAARDAFLGGL